MLGSFYTPGKAWKPFKSLEIPPKINPFGQCRSGQFFGFSWKLFLLHHPPMNFTIQKKFPELLDVKYASFGGKKSKWRDF